MKPCPAFRGRRWPGRRLSNSPHFAGRVGDAISVHELRIQAREELAGVQAYDRVLANSYFSRESMLRAYGIDATVCYLGVDTERYKVMGLARKRLVVGIGAFVPQKRVEVVIEAVARVSLPRPALAWIGNWVDPDYLKHLVRLAERREVDFTPHVAITQQEVVRVLNEAAVMAYAPRLEPFGYTPLEAGACGLPVVAQAEGGVARDRCRWRDGLSRRQSKRTSSCLGADLG